MHKVVFESHPNQREVRVTCVKCHANAIFHTEEQPPTPVQGSDGKWSLQASDKPFAAKDAKGNWTAGTALVERWLGKECPVSDEQYEINLKAPKPPPIVLSHGGDDNG